MRSHRALQVLFVAGLGAHALSVAVYEYSVFQFQAGAIRLQDAIPLLGAENVAMGVSGLIAIIPVLVGLYMILSRPRAQGARPPLAGFVIAVVGACLTAGLFFVSPFGAISDLLTFETFLVGTAIAGPLVLLGLGMMVLWNPALGVEPAPTFVPPMSPEMMK